MVAKTLNPPAAGKATPKARRPPRIILLASPGSPPMEDQLRDPAMLKRFAGDLKAETKNWLAGVHMIGIAIEIKGAAKAPAKASKKGS